MFTFSTRRRKQITELVVVVTFQVLTWHSDVCRRAFPSQLLVPQTCVGHSTGMQGKKKSTFYLHLLLSNNRNSVLLMVNIQTDRHAFMCSKCQKVSKVCSPRHFEERVCILPNLVD